MYSSLHKSIGLMKFCKTVLVVTNFNETLLLTSNLQTGDWKHLAALWLMHMLHPKCGSNSFNNTYANLSTKSFFPTFLQKVNIQLISFVLLKIECCSLLLVWCLYYAVPDHGMSLLPVSQLNFKSIVQCNPIRNHSHELVKPANAFKIL